MKKMMKMMSLVVVAGLVLALSAASANAAMVWNVNIGTEIDSTDNFVGAATENTANSTWNSVPSADQTGMALKDSTDAATGVTLDFNTVRVPSGTIYSTYTTAGQLEIFDTYAGADGVSVDFTLKGLDTGATYDLIIYSDWKWGNANYPVAQTTGTGMSGTIWINSTGSDSLVEDTDPANTAAQGNWFRITGLTPDVSGELAFDAGNGENGAFSAFQLINTIPEPATMSLLALGGLGVLARRRRR
jgi:hypothetical protein